MVTALQPKHHRRWPKAVLALFLAALLFLNDFAVELLAPSLQSFLERHRTLVWLVLGLGFAATLAVALWDYCKADESPEPLAPPLQSRNVSIGGNATHNVIATGSGNQIAHETQGDVVMRDKIVLQPAPVPPVQFNPLHQLPSPPAHFTGRTHELERLAPLLAQGGAVTAGVRGMGGVGKTALAIVLAHQVKDRYPDAQFFLDLQGASAQPLTAAAALVRIITSFQPEAKLPDDEAQLQSIYLSLLHEKRALIVLDNAPQDVVLDRLTPPPGSALLVTSRFNVKLRGVQTVPLDELPPDKAREYLLKVTARIGGYADELARLCGYLPLALELVAGALQVREELEPADYARRLERQPLRELDTVAAAFAVSYGLLDAAQQERWRALAVFPNTFDQRAAAAVWALDDADETLDALSALKGYSLIGYDAATRRWRLHDLARLFAAERLNEVERAQYSLRHAAHYCAVLSEAGRLYIQGHVAVLQGLNLYDQEHENIIVGQAWAAERISDEWAAQVCVFYTGPVGVNYLLGLRLHPLEWLRWLKIQLAAARRLRRLDFEGIALGNLGIAYGNLNEPRKAVEFFEQQLVIVRELNDLKGEGDALGNLGTVYVDLGESDRAIELLQQHLIIARKLGDRRGEGNALGNIGTTYASLSKLGKAIEFHKQSLEIAREIGDLRGQGDSLWNMSLSLNEVGKRTQAIDHAEGALKIYEVIAVPFAKEVQQKLAEWKEGK